MLFLRFISVVVVVLFSFSEKGSELPIVLDKDIQLDLVAESPTLMTPIGICIDSYDNIFVLESHTHMPPPNYSGAKTDRIKKGIDTNGDGTPDEWQIFANDIYDGMNITCDSEGKIFVAQKQEVLIFEDTNGDGIADKRSSILKMATSAPAYDHAAIMGLEISPQGKLYVSRGNTGSSHWKVSGSDESSIEGYGDGGNVFRCNMDGSKVEEVATGFWNPFSLRFTSNGHLLLTDNDPDSRGPNRLIEVVNGGDYGYKSIYGGSGIHPFSAWNGELPGTLPYCAPLGESPTDLIEAKNTNLPKAYQEQVLVNIWEENNIVAIKLTEESGFLKGKPQVLVQGGDDFHPVSFAKDSRGNIYFTDWVVRTYPNHTKGRLWKLSGTRSFSPKKDSKKKANIEHAYSREQLLAQLKSSTPFERSNARFHLKDQFTEKELLNLLEGKDEELQLQAILMAEEKEVFIPKEKLKVLLSHSSLQTKFTTLKYIASLSRTDFYTELEGALAHGYIPADLFEAYLSTVRHLQPAFIEAVRSRSKANANKIERHLPTNYIEKLLVDSSISEEIKVAALPFMIGVENQERLLLTLLNSDSEKVQLAAIQALRKASNPKMTSALIAILVNPKKSEKVRLEALSAISYYYDDYTTEVAQVINDKNPLLSEFAKKYVSSFDAVVSENETYANEDYQKEVNDRGSILRGKLLFQLPNLQCIMCHKVEGYGGDFGPGLSHVGSSKSLDKLASSILDPSAEMSPEWQGWYIKTESGETVYGRQIDVKEGSAWLLLPNGVNTKFKNPQDYGAMKESAMPYGLQKQLTPKDFNDLINYLYSLK